MNSSDRVLTLLEETQGKDHLSPQAYEALRDWIAKGRDLEELTQLLQKKCWNELEDAFCQTIPFGTGGRRGPMGIGPNRINLYTIRESAQGIVKFLQEEKGKSDFSVVISYDTRHNSLQFAEEVAKVFLGNGGKVYLFSGPRTTPELSFAVRYLNTDVGIMISASHNPPGDNGIKVYNSQGAQVVPPDDSAIIRCVETVGECLIQPLAEGLSTGRLVYVGAEVDEAYWQLLDSIEIYPSRHIAVAFSPLHGTGLSNGYEILKRKHFSSVFRVEHQCFASGDFPYVKANIPNPEVPEAMEEVLALAEQKGCSLALATDPDADRLGVGVYHQGEWKLLNGNQIGCLIAYHFLSSLQEQDRLPDHGVIFKTLPTTGLLEAIGRAFGVEVVGDLLVGFKYIAYFIENLPPHKRFLFGMEESHGYLLSAEVRDKDGGMACGAMAEIAAHLALQNKTLWDSLEEIWQKYGYWENQVKSVYLPGAEGRQKMTALLERLRTTFPHTLGGLDVLEVIDYQKQTKRSREGDEAPLHHPFQGNMLAFHLAPQKGLQLRCILRPSGTEPKMKCYFEASASTDTSVTPEEVRQWSQRWLSDILQELSV